MEIVEDEPVSMAAPDTHDVMLELVGQHLAEAGRVLELGAGQGAFARRLAESGHQVVAVDASSTLWRATEIPLKIADLDTCFADALGAECKAFDAVVAIEIIEHLENPFQFVRQCALLLRPGGLLFLSSPNVESGRSHLTFLYTGRLAGFGAYETVRPAHITPLFRWKLDMVLAESGFQEIDERFTPTVYATGTNIKGQIAGVVGRVFGRLLKGGTGGDGRLLVARLRETDATNSPTADVQR
jgi:2-polyprenyl-3-methyl-5-hydroxy-6-metoxy-1,4-benzoquinol methylase